MKMKIAGLMALLIAGHTWADQLGIYTFTSAAGSEATYPVDSQPANAIFSAMSRGTGVTASAGSDAFAATQWSVGALDADDYFEFTITASGGYAVTLTNLAFQERRSGTGIRDWSLRSSLDGYTADIATTNVPDDTSTRSQSVALGGSFADLAAVTFRLYGYTAEAGTGSWRIDNVALSGSIDSSGPPPTNVQFTVASQSVNEDGTSASVTIVKTLPSGNVSGSVTLGGTATLGAGDDYTIDTTNFTMNGATTSATFTITINDDAEVEGPETITLTLANVTGAGAGNPSTFTLTINDNDTPPETPEGIAAFRFTDGSLAVSTKDANISVSAMALSSGTIETNVTAGSYFPNEPYIEETGGWNQPSQDLAKNFFFTITPDSGYMVTITGISFRAYSTGAGPSAYGYDIGGGMATFAADAPDSSLVVVSNAVTGVDNQAGAITVMIQGWTNGSRATSAGGILKIDDVVVFGTVSSAGPVPPVLSPIGNKSTLTNAPLNFVVTATPTDGDPVTLSVSNAPVGSSFGSTNATGSFVWANPGPTGVYTVTFYATDKDGSDSEQITITVTSTPAPPQPLQTNIWFNELHYDNQGSDTNEGFEIAGIAGTDLSDYSVFLYDNSAGPIFGQVYTSFWGNSIALSGTIPDEQNGYGAVWFGFGGEINQMRNGPDGLALVYQGTQVVQFLSYEGAFTAANGPANGMLSEDTGTRQSSSVTPVDYTLQVCGTGTTRSAFTWAPVGVNTNSAWLPQSRGLLNDCQVISGGGGGYSQEQEDWIVAHWGSVGSYTGDGGDDDGDGYSNLAEYIAGTDPVPPSGASSYLRATGITAGGSRSVVVPSVTGRLYRLWSATDLKGAPQTWTEIGAPSAGNGGNLSLPDAASTNTRAYRLTVEMAP